MKTNYEIVGNTIVAKISSLSEKDLKAVKNYIALGYELVEYKKPVAKSKDIYTEEKVKAYLKEYGTKKDIETYEKLYNEPLKDNAKYTNDIFKVETYLDKDGTKHTKTIYDENGKKIIIHKKGDIKVKGFINALRWFRDTFKDYPEAPKKADK